MWACRVGRQVAHARTRAREPRRATQEAACYSLSGAPSSATYAATLLATPVWQQPLLLPAGAARPPGQGVGSGSAATPPFTNTRRCARDHPPEWPCLTALAGEVQDAKPVSALTQTSSTVPCQPPWAWAAGPREAHTREAKPSWSRPAQPRTPTSCIPSCRRPRQHAPGGG